MALSRMVVALGVTAALAFADSASAQSVSDGIDAVADAWVAQHNMRYGGARAEHPDETDRPALPLAARSATWPVVLHAAADTPADTLRAVMAALELSADALGRMGFAPPTPDGGAGGTVDFDLYLQAPVAGAPRAWGFVDREVLWAYDDSVSAFGMVSPAVPRDRLAACVVAAYANAVLLSHDSAEAPGWRHATAEWLAFRLTGVPGCEGAAAEQQQAPYQTWIDDGTAAARAPWKAIAPVDDDAHPRVSGAGGALLLELLSARYDVGDSSFVFEAWDLARQHTRGRDGLRGEPDLWQCIAALLKFRGERFVDVMADLSVARWFTGPPDHTGAAWLAGGRPPLLATFRMDDLPEHSTIQEPAVGPLGSVYLSVDVTGARPGERLRVWSRGEFGVAWSLMAVRFDSSGKELARLDAPILDRKPSEYLVVEPLSETATVLLVATNLSYGLPDAELPSVYDRTVKFIVDRATDEAAPGLE
jgi:hypothetical protein